MSVIGTRSRDLVRPFSELDRRLGCGDVAGAAQVASSALADGLEHPKFYYAIAQHSLAQARWDEALATIDAGLSQTPDDIPLTIARATALASLGRHEPAVEAFERALATKPESYLAGVGLAQALYNLGEYSRAKAQYGSIAAVAPSSPDPLAGLAMVAVREGQPNNAIELADRALRLRSDHRLALEAKGEAMILNGDFSTAEQLMRSLVATRDSSRKGLSTVLLRLGDALHGQARFGDAFDAYAAGKAELEERYRSQFAGPTAERMDARAERLLREMEELEPVLWARQPRERRTPTIEPPTHGFIVGFPRSGTTLLDEILAAHPNVVSLDERPTLELSESSFLPEPGGLGRLAAIDAASARTHRRAYWSEVDRFSTDRRECCVIDKQPMRSMSLPIISKLFPRARVLLAVRDPRDVVLGCFRRGFAMNATTYEFTSLESTARLYDAVMRLVVICCERLRLNLRIVRHEKLVTEFNSETSKILEFLGLDWADQIADFAEHARYRPIRTPSANQVRRGLTTEGFGGWRRYEPQLARVLPILKPWVVHWGYGE